MNRNKTRVLILAAFLTTLMFMPDAASSQDGKKSGYMAKQESIKGVFDALSTDLKSTIILSKQAVKKQISGNFDFSSPYNFLEKISHQLGLIWYQDGTTIYIYDGAETRSEMIALRNISLQELQSFLVKTKVYDLRYPLKGDDASATFYVSGPPIYVELVSSAARLLDSKGEYSDRDNVAVIPLYNSFVDDRTFKYRDERVTILGLATVLQNLMKNSSAVGPVIESEPAVAMELPDVMPPELPVLEGGRNKYKQSNTMKIIANSGTNSLIVTGSPQQIRDVRRVIAKLDVAKRHVELSVWIVDLQKDVLDQLGVNWGGNINVSSNLGITLNNSGGRSTLDGARFIASVLALSQEQRANVVSRPIVLTQENIPALFDNSRTFYTRLIGERSVELQHVTYGTLVSVLPRFTQNNEIEMMLSIEDGNEIPSTINDDTGSLLPKVGRTNISTIARVPKGKSLLIGGYTRDESSKNNSKIPWLGDIPFLGKLFSSTDEKKSNMVRVFLIQPREIISPLVPDAHSLVSRMNKNMEAPDLQDWVRNYMDSQKWSQ